MVKTKDNVPGAVERAAGIFFLSASLLLFELSLIRIYSVTLFYHFAFMAISVAMLGLALSGLVVSGIPRRFRGEETHRWAPLYTSLFAFTLPLVLNIVFRIRVNPYLPPPEIGAQLSIIYIASTVPFFFAGLVICGLFSSAHQEMGRLYAGDLVGAALGAVLVIPFISWWGGETIVFFISALGLVAAFFFARFPQRPLFFLLICVMVALGITNPAVGWVKMIYSKVYRLDQLDIRYNRWNAFSRVMVIPFRPGTDAAYTWAPSPKYPLPAVEHLSLMFDDGAASPVVPFDGVDLEKVRYLWYDLTALAHHLRGDGVTCIIGCGGGRDVLTAMLAGAKRVDAVDVNPLVFDAMNGVLATFSGNLYRHPNVRPIAAEGRSWARRHPNTYDLIQVAMIDTWAATVAGAYALSENSLYTVEAFKDFLRALKPNGLLTYTRFFFNPPRQALRLVSLYLKAAEELKIPHPEHNILVARHESLATLIFKNEPFTPEEVSLFHQSLWDLGFELVYSPVQRINPYFRALIESNSREDFYKRYPFDITPCTDERPFFFNLLKMKDFLQVFEIPEGQKFNYYATYILLVVLALSAIGTLMVLILPFLFGVVSLPPRWGMKLGVYFLLIGLGYIAVETVIIQRFVLLLENPLTASGAVLAGILVSSGLGSYFYWRWGSPVDVGFLYKIFGLLLIMLGLHTFVGRFIIGQTLIFPTGVKVLLALALIFPLGFVMGIPMPMGLKVADKGGPGVVAWCWAINSAASVVASPLAVTLAISYGFAAVLRLTLVFYLLAGVILLLTMRVPSPIRSPANDFPSP